MASHPSVFQAPPPYDPRLLEEPDQERREPPLAAYPQQRHGANGGCNQPYGQPHHVFTEQPKTVYVYDDHRRRNDNDTTEGTMAKHLSVLQAPPPYDPRLLEEPYQERRKPPLAAHPQQRHGADGGCYQLYRQPHHFYTKQPATTVHVYDDHKRRNDNDAAECFLCGLCAACLCCCCLRDS